MKLPSGKPGISRFVFVALLLVFNWPILSIPAAQNLLGWLYAVWSLAIALLFLTAHGATQDGEEQAEPRPDKTGPDAEGGGV